MSTEVATSQFAVLHGLLWPRSEAPVVREAALGLLRDRGLVAAVATAEVESGEPLAFSLAVVHSHDHEPRVALVAADGTIEVGGPAHEVCVALVEALGANVDLGGVWWDESDLPGHEDEPWEDVEAADATTAWADDAGSDDLADVLHGDLDDVDEEGDEDDDSPAPGLPGDVILTHQPESMVPGLARALGSGLVAGHVDGWTLVQFDEAWLEMAGEGWLSSELPVVHLKRSDERQRVVEVVTGFTQTQSDLLTRHADLTPVRDLSGVASELQTLLGADPVTALTNGHLVPDSALHEVLRSKHFADRDATTVATALQSPMDAHWSARVLTSLGLPTHAADVHEGRRELEGVRMEPKSLVKSLLEQTYRTYDPAPHEVAQRGPLGRAYARSLATPARTVAWVVGDLAIGSALVWAASSVDSTWLKVLVGVGAAGAFGDALGHVSWGPRKFRDR